MRFMPRIQKQYLSYCEGMNDDHVKEQYKQNRKKLDLLLGELFQELFRSGTNSTIVVFTSVSGNLEGSHGLWGSCYNGYEGSIHIPCILYMPSNLPVKQRIAKENLALSTSSVDLLPTLRKTDERAERFAFSSEPISNVATMLTVKAGNRSIVAGNYDTFDGMVVGMSRSGNGRNESFKAYAEKNGFTYTPVYFDTVLLWKRGQYLYNDVERFLRFAKDFHFQDI